MPLHRSISPAARGVLLFLGAFAALNVAGAWLLGAPGFDANIWWIDLRPIARSAMLQQLVSFAFAAAFLWAGLRPPRTVAAGRALAIPVSLAAGLCAANATLYYVLLMEGRITALSLPLPLSLCMALLLGWCAYVLWRGKRARRRIWPERATYAASAAACALGFALGQIYFFGQTDYRRPADVILVFGARTYADGAPSDALKDRVRTACDLYRAGYAPRLLFSGGPGDGAVHETEAMRRMAVSLGVPPSAIETDPHGLDTARTVANAAQRFRGCAPRILAVSHGYHLPRIKLACARAGLAEVYTVPARESYMLTKMPLLVAREVVALGVYYVRPLAS